MKLAVTFTKPNPDFNPAYAKQYHGGIRGQSENNRRNEWVEGSPTFTVKSFKVVEDDTYRFRAKTKSGEQIDVTLPNVTTVQCVMDDDSNHIVAVVSNKLKVKSPKPRNSKYDITRIYFYLNDIPFVCTQEGVYLSAEDMLALEGLPESLRAQIQRIQNGTTEDEA